ncbi:MAG: hypothetical protein ACRDPY_40340 [Streptosporangiaceae bacterium]
MHPEILRELTSQRGREMRARAHEAMLAAAASRAQRARRRGSALDEADGLDIPAIPDYVDGSFRVPSADGTLAGQAGRVPAARRAA